MTCKYIITKNHGNSVIANEFLTDNKCLCKSIRAWLYSVSKVNTKLASIL